MVMVNALGQMEVIIKEDGKLIRDMAKGNLRELISIIIKVTGKMILNMDKEKK
jgi:hypothetical protein